MIALFSLRSETFVFFRGCLIRLLQTTFWHTRAGRRNSAAGRRRGCFRDSGNVFPCDFLFINCFGITPGIFIMAFNHVAGCFTVPGCRQCQTGIWCFRECQYSSGKLLLSSGNILLKTSGIPVRSHCGSFTGTGEQWCQVLDASCKSPEDPGFSTEVQVNVGKVPPVYLWLRSILSFCREHPGCFIFWPTE